MSGFKINFVLRDIDKIVPWGEKRDYLSWFGLTDSDLWIKAGDKTIYEYSGAARKFWECDIRYNDYQLSRFLEDFSRIFEYVRESVPPKYYDIIGGFRRFLIIGGSFILTMMTMFLISSTMRNISRLWSGFSTGRLIAGILSGVRI